MGVEEGVVGSHEIVCKGYINTVNNQLVSIGAIINSTNQTKQAAQSMAKLISHSCGELQLAVMFLQGR